MKRKLWCSLVALLFAVPVAALASEGYVVDNVNLRAGPDPSYPLVDQLPAGTAVDVQGCTDGWEWCDVINEVDGSRGWIAGNYIQDDYQDQQVILSDYGAQIGVPIVAFSVGTYWDRYYRSRPFYSDRASWYNRRFEGRPPAPPRHGAYPGHPDGRGGWHGYNGGGPRPGYDGYRGDNGSHGFHGDDRGRDIGQNRDGNRFNQPAANSAGRPTQNFRQPPVQQNPGQPGQFARPAQANPPPQGRPPQAQAQGHQPAHGAQRGGDDSRDHAVHDNNNGH